LGLFMGTQKTISLDLKTAIIASRIPNFSHWVRQRLIEYARDAHIGIPEYEKATAKPHIAPDAARVWGPNKDQCNPRHRKGLCELCYPDGVDA